MRQIRAIFLSIVVFAQVCWSVNAVSGPTPSETNCGFYLDLEKDLGCWFKERDDSDYLVKYGYKFCNIFKNRALTWKDQRSAWVKKTTFCLQNGLKDFHAPANCLALEDAAFKMHPGCYRDGGFCNLSKWKKTTIVFAAFGIDILLKPTNSFGQAFRLLKDCVVGVSGTANALFERGRNLAETNPKLREELSKVFFLDGLSEKETDKYLNFALRRLLGEVQGADKRGIDAFVAIYGSSRPAVISLGDIAKKCVFNAAIDVDESCRQAAALAGSDQDFKAISSIPPQIDQQTIEEILNYRKKLKKGE